MRTDIQQAADTLRSRDGVRARYELRLQPGGETVTTWDSTYHSIGDDPGIPDTVVPQDVALVDGIAVSLIADLTTLKIQECFSAAMTTGQTCDPYSRPAIIDYDDTRCQIAWVNEGTVNTAFIDKSQLLYDHVVSLSGATTVAGVPASTYYALHFVAPDDLVIFYIDDGGIRAYSTLYDISSMPLYCPTKVYQASDVGDQLSLNYTGACRFNGAIFAYFSMYDGSVQATKLIENAGLWSDMYEAVAADLSTFKVSKTNVYNDKVIISGQFKRIDPVGAFSSPYVYGMVLSSTDGEIFAIDRHALFSYGNEDDGDIGANRFFALGVDAPDSRYGSGGPAFIYYGNGILGVGKCKYTVASQQYTDMVIKFFGADGSYNDGWALKAGNMPTSQYESIKLGDAADIYMGVPDDQGAYSFFLLQHGVIVRKSQTYEDGKVETSLDFEPWGASRLNDMTWPYYVELQGKQSIRDDMDEWDNLYKASEDGFLVGQFYADFWGEGSCDPKEAASGGTTEWTSIDLATQYYLAANPEISVLPINIKCYGWSRPGHTTNLETGGDDVPSDGDAENCTISVRLYIKRGEDDLIITIATPKEGETAHFPRTWYTDEDGYYPVTIVATEADNLEVGDVIEKVGMVFTNPNGSDASLNFPERIEIPEVAMHFESYEDTWARTEVAPFETSWNFGSGLGSWYASGDEAGDPIASYGWAHTNNAGWRAGMARCDLTIVNSEVVGATCPSIYASGHTGFNYNMPEGVIAGENAQISAEVDVAFVYHYIIDAGTAYISVHFDDDTVQTNGYGEGIIETDVQGETITGVACTWNISFHPTNVGKTVTMIRIGGAGRGYAIRWKSVEISGFQFEESEENDVGQQLQQTGVPVLYLATKPYYTINTEVAAKYRLVGEQSYGGVVALCNNAQNYVCARMSTTKVQIVKYRGGLETVLAETAHTHDADKGEWIKLKIEDGHFTVRTRVANVKQWSAVLCQYDWTQTDGQLIMEKDISHVGIYAFKDAPWFRITGYDPAMGSVMGVLPPGEDFDALPSSGQIRIEDCVYAYTGKQTPADTWGGPYQGRNTTDWGSYSYDGESYNGTAIEFIRFEWLNNGSNSDNFDSYLMAVETGFAWSVDKVDYKPSITTRGVRIFLKNRGRFFSPQAAGDQVGMSTRVWLTAALTGISKVSGEETTHSVGSLAFLASNSDVVLFEFAASSGHGPLTDRDMLDIVCKLSDAESRFPGDNEIASATLAPGTPLQVSP